NQRLLWKPLSEPRIPLKVGLVYRDAQRQHASVELLRSLLEGVV
ncbi:LysR family transcriptional regulator, partial [Pseudomonas aeruginosa]|nr:LysR family transcriptional regulator [Pseudomonas aeruginosa]MCF3999237.1 LysR family transcriptional regulator [Pseudomonas aeruginosa]